MSNYDFDLFVIGGGSGGVACARRASEYTSRVAICEDNQWGGTCVHRGCVPKKLLVASSNFGYDRELVSAYGWQTPAADFSWPVLRDNKTRELQRLGGFYTKLLKDNGITRIDGRGELVGPHEVRVGEKTYSAERILLATGGKPWVPSGIEGSELGITSDQIFDLPEFPKTLAIVGSGYIGTEFAGIMRGLGSDVHQFFRSKLVLPGFDRDIRATVQEEMGKYGVVFHPEDGIEKISQSGKAFSLTIKSGGTLLVDQVLLATGRTPRSQDTGLENVGIKLGPKNQVPVNSGYQTEVPSVYAIGDLTKRYELTPVAIAEGRALAESFFNGQPLDVNYADLATAVFSHPEVGTAGLTEDELRSQERDFDIYRAKFRPMKFTLPDKPYRGLIKLLVCPKTDRVLGCHLVGDGTGELIQALAICLTADVTKAIFDKTVAVHPTFAEELVLMRKPSEEIRF